jgi:hypothetical protein
MPDTRRQLLGQKVGSRFHHSTYIHYPNQVCLSLDSPPNPALQLTASREIVAF